MYRNEELAAVAAMFKALKKFREQYSILLNGDFSEQVSDTVKCYLGGKPERTGEVLASGQLGPVQFGKAEFSCPAVDDLLAMCGGLKALFTRLERPEVAGAGVAPWEEAE